MLKKFIIPNTTIEKLTILDIGEENNAATNLHANQRFRHIIHFVVKGKGIFKRTTASISTENNIYENCAFAIFDDDTVFYKSSPTNPLHYYWIGFSGPESDNIMKNIGFTQENPVIYFNRNEEIIKAFKDLFLSWNNGNSYDLYSAFFHLISILKKNALTEKQLNLTQTENEIFVKAEQFIKTNLHQNLKVQDVAQALNIDRSHFSRIFKKRFQTSPHTFINNLRLKEVEILLTTTNYTIQQIANQLNYPDVYALIKQFKTRYHVPPNQYRKDFFNNKSRKQTSLEKK